MQLEDFLHRVGHHPQHVAYALADGQPMKLLDAKDLTLEARLARKPKAALQLEICLEPSESDLEDWPKGPVLLKGEVVEWQSTKPGWKVRIRILNPTDILQKRRAARIRVHRIQLIGRCEGDSTWLFPVTVRDIGPEGLGIETREVLQPESLVSLSGFEEFLEGAETPWRFQVRSTFGKGGAGLMLFPDQDEAANQLKSFYTQLEVAGRFWRSLISHARLLSGQDAGEEVRTSIDFAVKQMQHRKGVQLALIGNEDFSQLHSNLKAESELAQIKNELENLRAKKVSLARDQRKRKRQLQRFLDSLSR